MKLSYKFGVVIVIVTMVSLIVLGLIFSSFAVSVIKSRISDQLISVSTLKENQLNNYIDRSKDELESLATDPMIIEYMDQFHGNKTLHDNGEHETIAATSLTATPEDISKLPSGYAPKLDSELYSGTQLSESSDPVALEDFLEAKVSAHFTKELNYSEFSSLSVLTTQGIVDLSTNPDEIGKVRSNEKYFVNGLKSVNVQNFYISISTRAPAMTVAAPIRNDAGEVVGVLVGDMRLNQISDIMIERSGLGNTGETLIINKNHLLVSESRFIKDIAFRKTIYTDGVMECLANNSGIKEYQDYRGVDIIGYFAWMPEREVCLVTKIDTKEAYSSLDVLYLRLFVFAIILLAISLFAAYTLSRFFTKQLGALVEGTEQWSKGILSHTIPITSNDEIAALCRAFNDASAEMLRSRELEKNYTKDLKNELEQKTKEMRMNLEELEQSKKASLNIMDDLSESNKHLQDLDKAKTDFLNVASHELKTPLTAISAYLEILDDYKGQFNKEQLQGLDAIKRNSNQLKMLIGNILEISRLDSGRFDLNIIDMDVKEKVISLVDNLKILSENKHIELKYDCDGVGVISTDAMRFEEILNNLVGNAIKFTDKGSVTVKTEYGIGKEKGFIVVSVIDTGVGIAENKMGELFQKFYQVDATVSRRYGGTGLGLSITKKMIELQGGKITVSSGVGKGTTFRFTLPIQPSAKSISKIDSNVKSKVDGLDTSTGMLSVDKQALKKTDTGTYKTDKEDSAKKDPVKEDSAAALKKSKNQSNSKQINRHTHKKYKVS